MKKNLTMCSTPRLIEPTKHHEFNPDKDSVEDMDAFLYMKHVVNMVDSESQPLPPAPLLTETSWGAAVLQSDYNTVQWECDTQGCFVTINQYHVYYPFATGEEKIYIHYGVVMQGMMTYYDQWLQEANIALRFQSFKNGDGVNKLMGSLPDNQALGE